MVEDGIKRVCVGAIAGAHGVRGDVRLKSFCADPAAIAAYGPVENEDGTRRFAIALGRPIKEGFAARLTGVDTRDAAEALRGTRLYVPRAALPALDDEEYYHADLIGLEVRDTGGARLGRVRAIYDHGAGDVIEIEDGPAAGLVLPFTRWAVPTVDLVAGVLIADPPDEDASAPDGTVADEDSRNGAAPDTPRGAPRDTGWRVGGRLPPAVGTAGRGEDDGNGDGGGA